MLLVEYSILDNVKVINESKNGVTKLKLLGKFQKCDEQNNNGRVYPRGILESQVKAIQGKIDERSLVGALDHPANDAIHLSQASHLITKLWVEKNGDVMGEAEILSTPNGKIVEALIGDGVKIGISSRGLGSVSENSEGKVVNEDFKLITFDLVSDPSTKGAFPELTESMRENSQRAQTIISKHKKDRVLMTMLESKITEAMGHYPTRSDLHRDTNRGGDSEQDRARRKLKVTYGRRKAGDYSTDSEWTDDDEAEVRQQAAWDKRQAAKKAESTSLRDLVVKSLKNFYESKMSDLDVVRQEKSAPVKGFVTDASVAAAEKAAPAKAAAEKEAFHKKRAAKMQAKKGKKVTTPLSTIVRQAKIDNMGEGFTGPVPNTSVKTPTPEDIAAAQKRDRAKDAARKADSKTPGRNERQRKRILNQPRGVEKVVDSTSFRDDVVNRIKEALRVNKPSALDNAMGGAPKVPTLKRKPVDKNAAIRNLNKEMGARAQKEIDDRRRDAEARNRGESPN